MKRKSFVLGVALLLCALLVGCNANPDFQYVDTAVWGADAPQPEPWHNSADFSFKESQDHIENVINFREGWQTNMQTVDGKLYFSRSDMVLCYDPATGRQTYLCTDPLCTHKSRECPFYFSNVGDEFYVIDDKVLYFGHDPQNKKLSVLLYSMTDRTTKVMRAVEGNYFVPTMIPLKDCYYFLDMIYDEEKDAYSYSLCRQNYQSKAIEVLRTDNDYNVRLKGVDGETVYLYDDLEGALIAYSTDCKTELSRIDLARDESGMLSICRDGYLILRTAQGELVRMNADGSDRHSLGITDVDYYYLTDSYIYYRTVEEKINGIVDYNGEDEEQWVDLQAVYRTDHEGKNRELVWKNQSQTEIVVLRDFIVDGGYLYANFSYCNVNGEKLFFTSNYYGSEPYHATYSRIDCSNGEIYYIMVQ